MGSPNTVFLHMFDWFIKKYGITTAEEREDNRKRMAADWQPTDGFEQLVTRLFLGAAYASAAKRLQNQGIPLEMALNEVSGTAPGTGLTDIYAEEQTWIQRSRYAVRRTQLALLACGILRRSFQGFHPSRPACSERRLVGEPEGSAQGTARPGWVLRVAAPARATHGGDPTMGSGRRWASPTASMATLMNTTRQLLGGGDWYRPFSKRATIQIPICRSGSRKGREWGWRCLFRPEAFSQPSQISQT
jgi:hypothetical protein